MNQSFKLFQSKQPQSPAPGYGEAIYTHPSDVANDPNLTTAEKKAILASWISDARAVENAPSLHQLDSGAVVEVDAIQRALVLLDDLAPGRGEPKRVPPSGRRGVISRLLRRVRPASGANDNDNDNDNDDDPPPAPAGFGVPFHPKPLLPAHGAYFETARELACA
jgi:hypothetical protein